MDEEPKKYALEEYMEKINSLFPLPPKPNDMCYDEFVNQLLAPYVLDEKTEVEDVAEEVESITSDMDSERAFRARMYKTNVPQRTRVSTGNIRQSILSEAQRDSALLTKQMFQVRFANLISDFRNVCIIYQLVQLQEILNVMREYPPAGTNPNDSIFVWSYKKNLKRFEQQMTTVYVDILEKNKSEATLDHLKYYVDVGELINLVQALLSDVIADRDVCGSHGFMDLLRDTQVDIDQVIALPYETIMAEHDSLMEQEAKKNIVGNFHNPEMVAKQRGLKRERFQIDYMSPIESRYKVNWTYDNLEQAKYTDFLRCSVLSDELDKLAELTRKDISVWSSAQLEYVTLIEQYKQRINAVQAAYDEDMETAENMVQATVTRVNKCKEDLKMQMEKVEMFHRKIKEVHEKIAKEKERERMRMSLARPSKRLSRVLARRKAEEKLAKQQAKLDEIKAKKEAKKLAKEQAKQLAMEQAKEHASSID